MKAKEPSPPKETNQVLSTSHQQQEPKEPNKAQVHKQKQDQSQSRERERGGRKWPQMCVVYGSESWYVVVIQGEGAAH